MTDRSKLTDLQRSTFVDVVRATRAGRWYRAGASGKATARGEAVTLASLFGRGLVKRRAWRGVEGEASAAHEYQGSDAVMEAVREAIAPKLNP